MRIIIETDSAAAARRITYAALEPQEDEAIDRDDAGTLADATDGGPPSEELLSSLRPTPDSESSSEAATNTAIRAPRRRGEDAGAAPAWLVGVVEGRQSRLQ